KKHITSALRPPLGQVGPWPVKKGVTILVATCPDLRRHHLCCRRKKASPRRMLAPASPPRPKASTSHPAPPLGHLDRARSLAFASLLLARLSEVPGWGGLSSGEIRPNGLCQLI